MSAFFDQNNHMHKELLGAQAEEWAKKFVYGDKPLHSAQLRKFYGDFKSLEKKLEFKEQGGDPAEAFLSVLPLIKMVKSKVAYASNPKSQKIPKEFADWLKKNIDQIETAEDFRAFMLHFEAVVGFFYGLGVSNS